MSAIHQEVTLKASPERVYAALTDAAQFSAFTGGAPAEISREAGGAFSCFGGMITGRNLELVPNRRLVQAWRAGNWGEGVYSVVRFDLEARGGETRLVFDHTGFPEEQRPHLEGGWQKMYWEPLRAYLK
jgi:uncharacterized protein YndB with AHSA1/START domain